ncbi:MAG: cytochrome c biogenesis protein CcdA [candidate division NC10 bacterium]|nr:cytochrome c biogenesis protein CcdA [candidate division NC10 bacterium]
MGATQGVSYLVAFSAGLLSFASPCVLPLIPAYITFITGLSLADLTKGDRRSTLRKATIFNSLFFILGFSTVFVALGASASLLGKFLLDYQYILSKVGGVLIILFGLFIAGFFRLDFLYREKRIHLKGKPAGYLGSLFVGATFALGWTPCVGPILSAILLYASTCQSVASGIALLGTYSLGLAIPFFLSSLALNSFIIYMDRARRYIRAISVFSGVFLILIGLLILTDYFRTVSNFIMYLFQARGV